MPTYDYACGACGHTFEQFQSIKADPLRVCPQCSTESLVRLLGAGAGVVFKGDGFYTTDYRSESYNSGAKADKPSAPGGESGSSADTGSSAGGACTAGG